MIDDFRNIYKNLEIFFYNKSIIFFKLRNNVICIKSQNLTNFPFFDSLNIGKVLILEHFYEFYPNLILKKNEKNFFFSYLDTKHKYNIDLRDLCIKNGEIVQNIKLVVLNFNYKFDSLNSILDRNFLFWIKMNRFSLNRSFSKSNKKEVYLNNKKMRCFFKLLEIQLFFEKRIFTNKKRENLQHNNLGKIYHISNEYYQNKIQSFIENILHYGSFFFICFIICLVKFYKFLKLRNQFFKFLF
jgi:hypothetical protein